MESQQPLMRSVSPAGGQGWNADGAKHHPNPRHNQQLPFPLPDLLSQFPTPCPTSQLLVTLTLAIHASSPPSLQAFPLLSPSLPCPLSSLTTSPPTPFPSPPLPPLLPHYKPSHSFSLPSPAPSPPSLQALPHLSPPLPCPLSSQAAANLS